jgi:hypothetical protein
MGNLPTAKKTDTTEYYLKQRILSKIANRSLTGRRGGASLTSAPPTNPHSHEYRVIVDYLL